MPTKKPVGKALNERQAKFAYHYVFDEPVGKHAAIKAGYTARSAETTAWNLLRNPKVKAEIERLRAEREARTHVTTDTVITRLNAESEGKGPDTSAASRVRALELLGRHLGMFRDKLNVELSGPGGEAVTVRVVMPDNGRSHLQPPPGIDLDGD